MPADYYIETGDYRIRAGTWPADELTSAHNVIALPRQVDQPGILDWPEPSTPQPPRRVQSITTSMDGGRGTFGKGSFVWFMGPVTPLMFTYFNNLVLPGGIESGLVTAMTYDPGSGWRVVNARLWRPDEQEISFDESLYSRIPYRFIEAVTAPPTEV